MMQSAIVEKALDECFKKPLMGLFCMKFRREFVV